ncbi:glycosyltransferase family 2 protein [Microbacterium sp. HA-8]|uniref:glycosyltransferase family 2 protein n=1 Tax=Microbacterium sp. HA-8 TaxID=3234200 RepID=UPI0038F72D2B
MPRSPRSEPADSRRHPAVTVAISVKDDGELLRRCLRALAQQTTRPSEVIVVDNGSSDESARIAKEAGARVISHPSGGIAAASAAGYAAASGEVIARLDADCVPSSTWIRSLLEALDGRPDVGAVTGGARYIGGPVEWQRVAAFLYLGAYRAVLTPALGHVPLFGSNMAMRSSAWAAVSAEVHRDDIYVHDDLDLSFHLGARHRIIVAPRAEIGIAWRPFRGVRALLLRIRRGFHSVWLHWPAQFPALRWLRRLLALR